MSKDSIAFILTALAQVHHLSPPHRADTAAVAREFLAFVGITKVEDINSLLAVVERA